MKIITDVTTLENVRKAINHLWKTIETSQVEVMTSSNTAIRSNTSLEDGNIYEDEMRPAFFINETNSYIYAKEFEGKTALCILGGGDTIIDLILNGYTKIIGIDINITQFFVAILKLNTVLKLSFSEFNKFWEAGPNCFSYQVIEKVLEEDEENNVGTLFFWKSIFEKYNWDSQSVRYYAIFGESTFVDNNIRRAIKPEYAKNSKIFSRAKKILSDGRITVELICQDIVKYVPNEKLDFIDFSNIYNYMLPDAYINLVIRYKDYLNQNGKIVTYIIQLLEEWIVSEKKEIHPSFLVNIPIINLKTKGRKTQKFVPDVIRMKTNQQLRQAREIYKVLSSKYNVKMIRVTTGKGYEAYYQTVNDTVMVIS